MEEVLTLARITTLALVNSVNPCQIAMLVMVLITILTTDIKKQKKLLFTGLAFTLGVFLGYLFYGMILIQLFKTFSGFIDASSSIFRIILASLSMIIGALQIKDFFLYEPGGIATEMPQSIRPYARLLIKKITSPLGAFIVGFLMTIFLAPCTSAPYILATPSLYKLGIIGALPWLAYFNLIAIIPLLIITFIVYKGFVTVEHISGWREKNIRILHLIAGLLLFSVGLAILMSWI